MSKYYLHQWHYHNKNQRYTGMCFLPKRDQLKYTRIMTEMNQNTELPGRLVAEKAFFSLICNDNPKKKHVLAQSMCIATTAY
jgi:hypothetical protein